MRGPTTIFEREVWLTEKYEGKYQKDGPVPVPHEAFGPGISGSIRVLRVFQPDRPAKHDCHVRGSPASVEG